MKPSDIELSDPVPLAGVFGKAEAEAAAAWIIRALAINGDVFRSVSGAELAAMGKVAMAAPDENPSWLTNPFLLPNIGHLHDNGWVVIDQQKPPMFTLTEEALALVRESRWHQHKSFEA